MKAVENKFNQCLKSQDCAIFNWSNCTSFWEFGKTNRWTENASECIHETAYSAVDCSRTSGDNKSCYLRHDKTSTMCKSRDSRQNRPPPCQFQTTGTCKSPTRTFEFSNVFIEQHFALARRGQTCSNAELRIT